MALDPSLSTFTEPPSEGEDDTHDMKESMPLPSFLPKPRVLAKSDSSALPSFLDIQSPPSIPTNSTHDDDLTKDVVGDRGTPETQPETPDTSYNFSSPPTMESEELEDEKALVHDNEYVHDEDELNRSDDFIVERMPYKHLISSLTHQNFDEDDKENQYSDNSEHPSSTGTPIRRGTPEILEKEASGNDQKITKRALLDNLYDMARTPTPQKHTSISRREQWNQWWEGAETPSPRQASQTPASAFSEENRCVTPIRGSLGDGDGIVGESQDWPVPSPILLRNDEDEDGLFEKKSLNGEDGRSEMGDLPQDYFFNDHQTEEMYEDEIPPAPSSTKDASISTPSPVSKTVLDEERELDLVLDTPKVDNTTQLNICPPSISPEASANSTSEQFRNDPLLNDDNSSSQNGEVMSLNNEQGGEESSIASTLNLLQQFQPSDEIGKDDGFSTAHTGNSEIETTECQIFDSESRNENFSVSQKEIESSPNESYFVEIQSENCNDLFGTGDIGVETLIHSATLKSSPETMKNEKEIVEVKVHTREESSDEVACKEDIEEKVIDIDIAGRNSEAQDMKKDDSKTMDELERSLNRNNEIDIESKEASSLAEKEVPKTEDAASLNTERRTREQRILASSQKLRELRGLNSKQKCCSQTNVESSLHQEDSTLSIQELLARDVPSSEENRVRSDYVDIIATSKFNDDDISDISSLGSSSIKSAKSTLLMARSLCSKYRVHANAQSPLDGIIKDFHHIQRSRASQGWKPQLNSKDRKLQELDDIKAQDTQEEGTFKSENIMETMQFVKNDPLLCNNSEDSKQQIKSSYPLQSTAHISRGNTQLTKLAPCKIDTKIGKRRQIRRTRNKNDRSNSHNLSLEVDVLEQYQQLQNHLVALERNSKIEDSMARKMDNYQDSIQNEDLLAQFKAIERQEEERIRVERKKSKDMNASFNSTASSIASCEQSLSNKSFILNASANWFADFESLNDDGCSTLLETRNSKLDEKALESKKRLYLSPPKNQVEKLNKKRKKKILKKLARLIKRKSKSKNDTKENGNSSDVALGISSVSSVNNQASVSDEKQQKSTQRIRFSFKRKKNKSKPNDSIMEDTSVSNDEERKVYDSIIRESLKMIPDINIEDLNASDISFSDSEVSDNTSCSSICGYQTLS